MRLTGADPSAREKKAPGPCRAPDELRLQLPWSGAIPLQYHLRGLWDRGKPRQRGQ